MLWLPAPLPVGGCTPGPNAVPVGRPAKVTNPACPPALPAIVTGPSMDREALPMMTCTASSKVTPCE